MFGPSHRLLKTFSLAGLAVLFYFFARLEFLLWNWSLFQNKPALDILWSFFVGLRFDISAALSVVAPLLLVAFLPWPRRWQGVWESFTWITFAILQVPFMTLNLVDTEFINFVGRRFTSDSFFILGEIQGKMWNFASSYWQLFVINTVLLILLVLAGRKIVKAPWGQVVWASKDGKTARLWAAHGFLCFVALAISVVGIRGGLQGKPISFVNANIFTAPLLNNLILNSTFTVIKSYGAETLKKETFFTDKEEMLQNLNGSLSGSLLDGKRPAKPQNIMIIVLESFGQEYVGPVEGGKSYTPFLDELMQKSLVFQNSYANGRRSIEGIGAVMAGIPALMNEPFISSHFTANYFVGLGTVLGQKGYSTSFFHGGHNGTMYFDSFMQSAGVEKYFGSTEYGNSADDDGVWGIWDEPFLQWMLTQLDTLPQPFMTSVFTLSSHQPFKVPEQYTEMFPEGPLPILKTIAYSDFALRKFFAEAEKKPWYKDTLFIVTADHTGMHYRKEYENDMGSYRIPLFLFHPSFPLPNVDKTTLAQQVDVMPTVLDFLGISQTDKIFLGSSLFIPGDKVVVNFIDGRYILFAKDYFLRWTSGGGEPQMFSILDRDGTSEVIDQPARKKELVNKLKAHIQYFTEGMWDNKLYYPSK